MTEERQYAFDPLRVTWERNGWMISMAKDGHFSVRWNRSPIARLSMETFPMALAFTDNVVQSVFPPSTEKETIKTEERQYTFDPYTVTWERNGWIISMTMNGTFRIWEKHRKPHCPHFFGMKDTFQEALAFTDEEAKEVVSTKPTEKESTNMEKRQFTFDPHNMTWVRNGWRIAVTDEGLFLVEQETNPGSCITRDTFDKAAVFTDVVAQESINPPTEKETTKPVNGPDGDGWLWNLENYEWTKEGFSIKQGGDRFWVRTAWTDKGMACTESRPTLKEAKEFGDRMIEQRKKTDSVKPIEPCDGWVQQKRSDVVEWTKEGISIKYEDGKFWVRSPHDMSQVGIARIESRPILAEAKLLGDTIIEHWKKIEERKKSDPVKPPDAHTNEGWRSFFPDSDMWVNNKLHIKRLSPSKFFLSSYESDVIYHYEPMTFATLKEAKTEGDYWLKHGERSLPPGFEPIIPPPPPNTFDVDELIRHLKNEKPPGPFASLILLESVIYLLERERARILQGG